MHSPESSLCTASQRKGPGDGTQENYSTVFEVKNKRPVTLEHLIILCVMGIFLQNRELPSVMQIEA